MILTHNRYSFFKVFLRLYRYNACMYREKFIMGVTLLKKSYVIKFLYHTVIGRFVLKLLIDPNISRASAWLLSSSFSRCLVPLFVRKNRLDMSYYVVPKGGYRSFNDFFTRHMKEEYIEIAKGELLSPCDGLMTVSDINEDSIFCIKHTEYSLKELLKSEELAQNFQGGTAFIFRLTPAHYHRYIWSTTGFLKNVRRIQGVLHSVQPICHERENVFIQNTREYAIVNNATIGSVLQMEIGALLVGKISNHDCSDNRVVCAGQEKGFFEYGGSSIVILIRGKIELPDEIIFRDLGLDEIPVAIGERIIK